MLDTHTFRHAISSHFLLVVRYELQSAAGIQLEELKDIKHSILIASGTSKVSGVHATLTGGYCNHVIIDTLLAQNLLVR
ncbi:sugar-binding domain-containing protein [Jeotgalibaca porci]|uniref:sugar-binding domain-containing protein n=1 Tax=Jeotgalibaca porci TaxID=1868793 RepID=UPI0035A0ECB0